MVQVRWDDIKLVCGAHIDVKKDDPETWKYMQLVDAYPLPRYDCPANREGEAPVCRNRIPTDVFEKLLELVGAEMAKEYFILNKTIKFLKAGDSYKFTVIKQSQTEIVVLALNMTKCS